MFLMLLTFDTQRCRERTKSRLDGGGEEMEVVKASQRGLDNVLSR